MPIKKGAKIDFLNAYDANELRKRHSLARHRAVYGLIEILERRIHFNASSGAYDTLFEVPMFVPDLPAYHPPEMAEELLKHFRRQNYYVRPVSPTVLYVSWRFPVRDEPPAQPQPPPPPQQPPQRFQVQRRNRR